MIKLHYYLRYDGITTRTLTQLEELCVRKEVTIINDN